MYMCVCVYVCGNLQSMFDPSIAIIDPPKKSHNYNFTTYVTS